MTSDDIERINRFVGLQSPKSNKSTMKLLLILLVLPVMVASGNSIMVDNKFFALRWMIFIPVDCLLLLWGLYLIHTLEKHQFHFFLFEGIWGGVFVIECFALGYSFGIHVNHFSPVILWLLIFLDVPVLFFLTAYRIKLYHGKGNSKKKTGKFYPISLSVALVLVLAPILNGILNRTQIHFQHVVATLCLFFIGYVFSVHIIFLGNFFVVQKYREIINLYNNGVIQKSAKRRKNKVQLPK